MPYNGQIPGYYYDSDKDKYFRVQPNHRAPSGALHSLQNVNSEKRNATFAQQTRTRKEREKHELIKRSPWLKQGRSTFNLRLGKPPQINIDWLTKHYGRTLQHQCFKSYIDQLNDRTLSFSISQSGRIYRTTHDLAFSTPVKIELLLPHDKSNDNQGKNLPTRTGIHYAMAAKPGPINAVNPNYVLFSTGTGLQAIPINGDGLCDSHRAPINVRTTDTYIWDIAAIYNSPNLALATSEGLRTGIATETDLSILAPTKIQAEQMNVSFKDANVIMSGQRNGQVNFTDMRQAQSVARLRHSSAVTGICTTRNSNNILVGGLGSMALYDLRITPEISRKGCSDISSLNGQISATNPSAPKRPKHWHHNHTNNFRKIETKPLLRFNIPFERQGDQYRTGSQLAYSSLLDIAVLATNSSIRQNTGCVTLFACNTGKIMDSPLTRHGFSEAVNEIKMHRVRDGPEDIFVLAGYELQEWSMYHRVEEPEENSYGFIKDCRTGMADLYDRGDRGP